MATQVQNGGESRRGDRLDEYVLMKKLGGHGCDVFKAWHVRLKRYVAIKLFPRESVTDENAMVRLQREITAAGMLNHPNFFCTYDAREVQGAPILVMEYVDGIDLARLVDHGGPLSIANACEAARQIAVGLDHADRHGLVHRDIKPSNLVLTWDGVVKILDLGLVLIRRAPSEWTTVPGQLVGTAEYTAPEQVLDSHAVDIRADLYSLGCLLFKLLIGRPPFSKQEYQTDTAIVEAHINKPAPALRQLRKDVPRKLANIAQRLLAKKAKDRYFTCEEVALALAPFATGADLCGLIARVMLRMQTRLELPHEPPNHARMHQPKAKVS